MKRRNLFKCLIMGLALTGLTLTGLPTSAIAQVTASPEGQVQLHKGKPYSPYA